MKNIYTLIIALMTLTLTGNAVAHEGHGSTALGGAFHAFEHPLTWAVMAVVIVIAAFMIATSSEE